MKPRVLLVEDDASIRRFVELALEEMPIELLVATSLAEARAVLATGPVRLVLSDLMLPDGSGVTLLQALVDDPALRAGARLAAFSAGVTAERRAQLEALGVDDVLSKPVALSALEACVERALGAPSPPPALPAADPVAEFFGGNQALFDAYRASCLLQFREDVRVGDAARAGGDLASLRRLAHSLKTVLQTLGDPDGRAQALALENLAAAGDATHAHTGWDALRARLLRMASGGTD